MTLDKEYEIVDRFLQKRRSKLDLNRTERVLNSVMYEKDETRQPLLDRTYGISRRVSRVLNREETPSEQGSESEQNVFRNLTEADRSVVDAKLKPLENLPMVKSVRRMFSFREDGTCIKIIELFHFIYWTVTHPTTIIVLMHIGRIVLDLFLTLILLGVSIIMSLLMYGGEICKNKQSNSETRLVLKRPLMTSTPIHREPIAGTSTASYELEF